MKATVFLLDTRGNADFEESLQSIVMQTKPPWTIVLYSSCPEAGVKLSRFLKQSDYKGYAYFFCENFVELLDNKLSKSFGFFATELVVILESHVCMARNTLERVSELFHKNGSIDLIFQRAMSSLDTKGNETRVGGSREPRLRDKVRRSDSIFFISGVTNLLLCDSYKLSRTFREILFVLTSLNLISAVSIRDNRCNKFQLQYVSPPRSKKDFYQLEEILGIRNFQFISHDGHGIKILKYIYFRLGSLSLVHQFKNSTTSIMRVRIRKLIILMLLRRKIIKNGGGVSTLKLLFFLSLRRYYSSYWGFASLVRPE